MVCDITWARRTRGIAERNLGLVHPRDTKLARIWDHSACRRHTQRKTSSNRWLSCILVDAALSGGVTRETIRLRLEEENIESRPLWKPMHMQPVFADAPYYGGSVAEQLFHQGLCLPSGSNLTQADLNRIVETITPLFD